jgi:hypothetical protein
MARRATSYPEILTSWNSMIQAIAEKPEVLANLQEPVGQLKALLEEGLAILKEQNDAAARSQTLSRRIADILTIGREVATNLRHALRGQYGARNKDLLAFGVQPFRRRSRASTPQEPAGPATTPPSSPAPPSQTTE